MAFHAAFLDPMYPYSNMPKRTLESPSFSSLDMKLSHCEIRKQWVIYTSTFFFPNEGFKCIASTEIYSVDTSADNYGLSARNN